MDLHSLPRSCKRRQGREEEEAYQRRELGRGSADIIFLSEHSFLGLFHMSELTGGQHHHIRPGVLITTVAHIQNVTLNNRLSICNLSVGL